MRQIDRLQQVIGGAVPHRLDRAFERRMAGDDDHLRREVARRRLAEQLEAVAVGQDEVEQDHVGRGDEKVARLFHRVGASGGESLVRDQLRQRFRGVAVVVDDQSMRHAVRQPARRRCN